MAGSLSGMTTVETPPASAHPREAGELAHAPRRTPWTALTGAFGAISGVAPHVLHHVGPLVGAAIFAGAGGTLLFGAVGLLASIPFLLRLHRRFRTWLAPGLAVGFFAGTFLLSTLWLGPIINRSLPSTPTPASPTSAGIDHAAHHR